MAMDDRGDDAYRDEEAVNLSQDTLPPVAGRKKKIWGLPRWTLGICLLMVTVVMWTASSFLASYIFADNTFSKPFFVTYVNTSVFAFSLIPMMVKRVRDTSDSDDRLLAKIRAAWKFRRRSDRNAADNALLVTREDDPEESGHGLIGSSRRSLVDDSIARSRSPDDPAMKTTTSSTTAIVDGAISFSETIKLSVEFCALWYAANYFAAACLEYTTVASATILSSTSSIWTLFFGSLAGVESFTFRKLTGVCASLTGIVLISSVDLSGSTDDNRGSFPHKSTKQLAIGDGMAFFSAILYGFYTVLLKKRIGDESRVDVLLFFALVGFFNIVLIWPGFIILHFTGVERFEFPTSARVWIVVISNSLSSFLSDLSWAFAMLFTSPLVVTVGLGLTIPLSLVGQIVLASQYSSAAYWIGAGIVLLSFIFINHEGTAAEKESGENEDIAPGGVGEERVPLVNTFSPLQSVPSVDGDTPPVQAGAESAEEPLTASSPPPVFDIGDDVDELESPLISPKP